MRKAAQGDRMLLYREAESLGVGISVMKPFSGGQLLSPSTSPFGKALTPYQCIKYALDKPAVLTVLPGMRNREEVESTLRYFDVPDEEKDYSMISSLAPEDARGRCVYCNHCHRALPESILRLSASTMILLRMAMIWQENII